MNQSMTRGSVVGSDVGDASLKVVLVVATIMFTLAAIGAVINYSMSHRVSQTAEAGAPVQQ